MNILNKTYCFYKSVRKKLAADRVVFSERKFSCVVAEQIKISSFPLFVGASLSLFCVTLLNGQSKEIIKILEEFVQFGTLSILLVIILVFSLISVTLGLIRDKLPRWLPHYAVDGFLNWILYWSFAISSGLSALILGGSVPSYFGLLDIGDWWVVLLSTLFFLAYPSLYYLISLITKPEFKDYCYKKSR